MSFIIYFHDFVSKIDFFWEIIILKLLVFTHLSYQKLHFGYLIN